LTSELKLEFDGIALRTSSCFHIHYGLYGSSGNPVIGQRQQEDTVVLPLYPETRL